MNNFINKAVDKNGVEADIQDSRVDSLITEVEGKQDTLIAGNNITIEGNVISAKGDEETLIDLSSIQEPTGNDFLQAVGFDPVIHAGYANRLILKNLRVKYYNVQGHYNADILFNDLYILSDYGGSYLGLQGNSIPGNSSVATVYSQGASYETLKTGPLYELLKNQSYHMICERPTGSTTQNYLYGVKADSVGGSEGFYTPEELVSAGGGTQLYKHEFILSKPHPQGAGTIGLSISIVSLSPTPITELSSMYGTYFFVHDEYLVKNMVDMHDPTSFGLVRSGPGSTGYVISYIDFANGTIATNWIDADTTISDSDTVTAL